MVPYPNMAAYCATKAYVNSFTLTLAAELKPYGVTVTCLAPGANDAVRRSGWHHPIRRRASRLKDMFAAWWDRKFARRGGARRV